MKHLVIIDTETTGLDPAKDHVIEVAAALYDIEERCVLESFASLAWWTDNPAQEVNRIPAGAVKKAAELHNVWAQVSDLVGRSFVDHAAFVAHRAEFDRGFTPDAVAQMLPWICSKFDVEWPRSKPGASLVEVALAHDVPVHANHRALTDVMLLAKTFERIAELGHDVHAMLARAMRPKVEVVSLAPFEQKDTVKAAGFSWDPSRRVWSKRMPREDIATLPFRVREVTQ